MKFYRNIFFTIIILTSSSAGAQSYRNAIGLRIGFGVGLTYKTLFDNKTAFEMIAAYQYEEHGYTLTGLYEFHNFRATKTSHMALIYGGGMHAGYYNRGFYKNRGGIYYEENSFNVGIDAIFGIDYFEAGSSINWGIDIKPMFDFINPGFRFWDAGASIRYVF